MVGKFCIEMKKKWVGEEQQVAGTYQVNSRDMSHNRGDPAEGMTGS
jgi:hypothetical protein